MAVTFSVILAALLLSLMDAVNSREAGFVFEKNALSSFALISPSAVSKLLLDFVREIGLSMVTVGVSLLTVIEPIFASLTEFALSVVDLALMS